MCLLVVAGCLGCALSVACCLYGICLLVMCCCVVCCLLFAEWRLLSVVCCVLLFDVS